MVISIDGQKLLGLKHNKLFIYTVGLEIWVTTYMFLIKIQKKINDLKK